MLASRLSESLEIKGFRVWHPTRMSDVSQNAMTEGLTNSRFVIVIPTPEVSGQYNSSYFSRFFCTMELRGAVVAGACVIPVCLAEHRSKIGEMCNEVPDDIKRLPNFEIGDIDWLCIYTQDPEVYDVTIHKLVKKMEFLMGSLR
jgi:hypothetical protein